MLTGDSYRIESLCEGRGKPYTTVAHVSQLKIYRNATDDDFNQDIDEESDFAVDSTFYDEDERRIEKENGQNCQDDEDTTMEITETATEKTRSGRTVRRPKHLSDYV